MYGIPWIRKNSLLKNFKTQATNIKPHLTKNVNAGAEFTEKTPDGGNFIPTDWIQSFTYMANFPVRGNRVSFIVCILCSGEVSKHEEDTTCQKHLITFASQLPVIFGLLVQSHSPLCSLTCKTKSDRNLRPLR